MYITDFKNGYSIGVTGVIGIVVVLTSIFQFATWGFDRKVQKDEMGKKVATISAKTSYHILTISLFVLWVADRIIFVRRNDFGNISLFAAICLSLVIFPIVQFFSARQYK
jgi:magnesium-transporting ATPase (P-type)